MQFKGNKYMMPTRARFGPCAIVLESFLSDHQSNINSLPRKHDNNNKSLLVWSKLGMLEMKSHKLENRDKTRAKNKGW
jgi:hypothetical protein